jgi:hypothetical protein
LSEPRPNSFPIVGKPQKIFSNHWKNRTEFSNHWKNIFQSLENPPLAGEAADCATPKGGGGRRALFRLADGGGWW